MLLLVAFVMLGYVVRGLFWKLCNFFPFINMYGSALVALFVPYLSLLVFTSRAGAQLIRSVITRIRDKSWVLWARNTAYITSRPRKGAMGYITVCCR